MKPKIYLHEQFRKPESEKWLSALPAQVAKLPDSQLIQAGRNRVYWIEHNGQKFVVKHFFNSGPWKKIVYRIWSGKARRSFDNSLALIQAGLKSPQPVAWREDWNGLFLKESFYVSAHLDVAYSARAIRQKNTGIDWTPHVATIARAMARMHEAGLLHRDLTAGNFLFVGPNPEQWELHIIDTNRMSFGPIDMRKGIQSLLQPKIEAEHLEAYVTTYAEARNFNPDTCLDLYKKLMVGHNLKWKIKNLTRPWRRKIGL